MKKAKKFQLWTTAEMEHIEQLDKICRNKYWTRTRGIREAIINFIKLHDEVYLDPEPRIDDNMVEQ